MAEHAHKQIRDALVAALTGLPTTGSRVWANRLRPMQDADLPGLRVFVDGEEAEGVLIEMPQLYVRRLAIVIEGVDKASSALDDTLDRIGKEVEMALAAGITVGGNVLEVVYSGMRFEDEQLDRPVGVRRMMFSVSFQTMANAPDVFS